MFQVIMDLQFVKGNFIQFFISKLEKIELMKGIYLPNAKKIIRHTDGSISAD